MTTKLAGDDRAESLLLAYINTASGDAEVPASNDGQAQVCNILPGTIHLMRPTDDCMLAIGEVADART